MSDLRDLIGATNADVEAIASHFNDLCGDDRIEACRALDAGAQARLWELCAGRAVELDDMVPRDRDPLQPVRHFGKNSLPMFTHFEKRFCRPATDTEGPCLWGYNEGATRPLVGPGYFVCRPTPGDERGALVIDYYKVPPEKPESWPAIKSNESGITRVVYGFMHDFLRRVSAHVTIGRAWKHEKRTNNYFILCRER